MSNSILTYRLARHDDLEALKALMDGAISELQKAFLDESQIASSRAIMGLDTQLIEDGIGSNTVGRTTPPRLRV